jgi:hypothetical protein
MLLSDYNLRSKIEVRLIRIRSLRNRSLMQFGYYGVLYKTIIKRIRNYAAASPVSRCPTFNK